MKPNLALASVFFDHRIVDIDSMLDASEFVRTRERRQGLRVNCPEEVAFRMGFISRNDLARLEHELGKSDYGRYLTAIAEEQGPATGGNGPRTGD